MSIPRRVRRRLLLPPGWVALGFLLLLGCQALRPWAGQLKQWNVMQITMPELNLKPSAIKSFGKEYQMPYKSATELNSVRPWHTVEFRGSASVDSLGAIDTESAIRKIIADTRHAGGVRVRFLPGATYANLVKVLDIMNYTGQKKYWLDIHHKPTTLYAITNKSSATGMNEYIPYHKYFFYGDVIRSPQIPVAHPWQQLLAEFWLRVVSLRERAWRQPLVLLLVISSLILGRLLFRKQRYANP